MHTHTLASASGRGGVSRTPLIMIVTSKRYLELTLQVRRIAFGLRTAASRRQSGGLRSAMEAKLSRERATSATLKEDLVRERALNASLMEELSRSTARNAAQIRSLTAPQYTAATTSQPQYGVKPTQALPYALSAGPQYAASTRPQYGTQLQHQQYTNPQPGVYYANAGNNSTKPYGWRPA